MNIKNLSLASVCFSAFFTASTHAAVVVNDTFPTAATTASYFGTSSGSSSVEINLDAMTGDIDSIGLVTGSSGRQMHALFDTVTLTEIGDSVTASITILTPATTALGGSDDIRIGLFDHLERTSDTELGQNISASSGTPNPLIVGLPGITIELDVDSLAQTTTERNINIRQSAPSESGRLLGTNTGIGNVSSGADLGYQFVADTLYNITFTITRIAGATATDDLDIAIDFSSIDGQGTSTLIGSHSDTVTPTVSSTPDEGAVFSGGVIATTASTEPSYSFGMLGMGASTNAFGSSNSSGVADNGVDIVAFTVDAEVSGEVEPPVTETEEQTCFPVKNVNNEISLICL